MRRVYIIVSFVVAIAFMSCEITPPQTASPRAFVSTIWNEAHLDIRHVQEILMDVVRLDYMVKIEDEELQDRYLDRYFGSDAVLSEQPKGYLVQHYTSIGTPIKTYYTTNGAPLGEDVWSVRYTGGNSYELTLTPQGDGRIRAAFTTLYINESSANADIIFSFEVGELSDRENTEITIEYEGSVESLDTSASESKPLTLTSATTRKVMASDQYGFLSGEFYIECDDKYFGTSDELFVTLYSDPQYVIVTYYGESYRLDGRYGI